MSPLELNDCGCCQTAQTPLEVANRPGLSAVVYRVGVHGQFLHSMLADLTSVKHPALRGLTTRDSRDFSIALLDAWATVLDVLSFYQERIANEGYLRTATERLSVQELARLIGYRLRPGAAARAWFAFTIEDAPGAPEKTDIPLGTKVMSIPGPGEHPQTFETIEPIEGRGEWNAMKPLAVRPQEFVPDMDSVLVQGSSLNLAKGDWLLLDTAGGQALRRISAVLPDHPGQRSRIELEALPSAASLKAGSASAPQIVAFRSRAALFGHNALSYESVPASRYADKLGIQKVDEPGIQKIVDGTLDKYAVIPSAVYPKTDRTLEDDIGYAHHQVYLDRVYPGITRGSLLVLEKSTTTYKTYTVEENTETTRADFDMSARVSRLTLDSNHDFGTFGLRETTVLAETEILTLADEPDPEPISGSTIVLDRLYSGLNKGQAIACTGLRTDSGEAGCEVLILAEATTEGSRTQLRFDSGLERSYERSSVSLNGNVAPATHGETVRDEVLGSGDAAKPYQRFALRQPPLTYVPAKTTSGVESTLKVSVSNMPWEEVPTLFGRGPKERVFVTRQSSDGATTLTFGDGTTGARLPTGVENVRATYRKGIGLDGQIRNPGQLSLLMTRPLGVRSVTNPAPASGADDPERLEDARRNAPMQVLTLDRVVSLQDYEDFARSFAGIAKALATWAWDGHRRGILITVAGPGGESVSKESRADLLASLKKAGDPRLMLWAESYLPSTFTLSARIRVEGVKPERVLADVEARLRTHYSFEARQFNQPASESEAIGVMQAVAGVAAVDLDTFVRHTPFFPGRLRPAGLLTLDPGPVDLKLM